MSLHNGQTSPLSVGDIIETNYGTGPYRILEIERGCSCQSYLDDLNRSEEDLPPAPEHFHLTLAMIDQPDNQHNRYWLNRYLEVKGRILSVGSDDEIFVIGKAKGQLSLF